MSKEHPVLVGRAQVSLWAAGAADLDSPILDSVFVNSLRMEPQVRSITRRITGASSYKHAAIVTHHVISWERVEALGASDGFPAVNVGRLVMAVYWEPDGDVDFRWKRRLYSGVVVASEGLVGQGVLQLNSSASWTAEGVEDQAGSGAVPAISLPLAS